MSAWTYNRIVTAKDAWAEAKRLYPAAKAGEGGSPKPKPHAIRADGTGPQF